MSESPVETPDFFQNLKDRYTKVLALLEDKLEDKSEPYRNKYSALEILKSLLDELQNAENSDPRIVPLLGVVYLNLGIVSIETEDLKSGEEYLSTCLRTLEDKESSPDCILSVISALNQLGIVWSRRDEPKKAKNLLDHAKLIYEKYKSTESTDPIGMSALFGVQDGVESEPKETMEKLHTLTLYYLAQIHGSLENYFESAVYCHETLSRQLGHKDFDMVEWALNAATLSQFFMEKSSFSKAKHHLGAATYILDTYKDSLEKSDEEKKENEEARAAAWENYKHRNADVARCWAKYGIALLSASRDRLLKNAEKDELPEVPEVPVDSFKNLEFETIEKDVEMVVADVTDQYLLDFGDARVVFLKVQRWLDEAKDFYTLENHASDYVQVVQDMSQAYKYLAFFEGEDDRRAKMHKRRVDVLEGVVKELNPTYYQAACRELWMELGETYSDILDIKLDRLRAMEERPSPKVLAKINELSVKAIENFQKFVDSVMQENHKGSGKIPEEMARPVLCAHFHLGRLYNAFISPDKKVQLEKSKKCLKAYLYLVNYCEKDEKAREAMAEELNVCKELVELLPLKIRKLEQECEAL